MATKTKNRIAEVNGKHDTELERSPLMQLEVVVFKLKGLSPLLQNNPAEFIGVKEGLVGKKEYKDTEEANLRTYRDADGNYCHPSESIVKAIVRACSGKKIGKVTAGQLAKSALFAAEPYLTILGPDGEPMTEYSIDRRSVVIGKARVLRCRPCFANWTMSVPLEIDMSLLTKAFVAEFLRLAGRFPGIGDYRPEKGGSFGRFEVVG